MKWKPTKPVTPRPRDLRETRKKAAAGWPGFVASEWAGVKAALDAPTLFRIMILFIAYALADNLAWLVVGFALGASGGELQQLAGLPATFAQLALLALFIPRCIRAARWGLRRVFPMYL